MPRGSSWFSTVLEEHVPVLLAAGLVDVDPVGGRTIAWEASVDRDGHQVAFPCPTSSSAAINRGSQLASIDNYIIEYASDAGWWRVSSCSSTHIREGLPNPNCRNLGFGFWPTSRELVYLGLGRVMLWSRKSRQYDVYHAHSRNGTPLNAMGEPAIFRHTGHGWLYNIDNRSALHHMRLPLGRADEHGMARHRHVVLEITPSHTYRVWNSEGWTVSEAFLSERRSPLAGPVGRGEWLRSMPSVRWATAPTEPILLELDAAMGTYRTMRAHVLDMDSLDPATTRQPPLEFVLLSEGAFDQTSACERATTREACALLGGSCGWCEQRDGVRKSHCVAGSPDRPCVGACTMWYFSDTVSAPVDPPPQPPPPPSPPGLTKADLLRLEAYSRRVDAWQQNFPPSLPDVHPHVHDADSNLHKVVEMEARMPPGGLWVRGKQRLRDVMQGAYQHVMDTGELPGDT